MNPPDFQGRRALRLATYNVHGFVSNDGRSPIIDDVIHTSIELGVDVLALQEVLLVDSARDPLADLSSRCNLHATFVPTMRKQGGRYGNAVLSWTAPTSIRAIDLGLDGQEPRNALDLHFMTDDASFRVLATHLGVRVRERHRQLELLAGELAATDESRIVLGDFNAWIPRGDVDRTLRRCFGRPIAPRSFPAWRPLLRLDRIYVDRSVQVLNAWAHDTRAARRSSDHLPVVAEVELPRAS